MEAQVTLKLSPAEFDAIRDAVEFHAEAAQAITKTSSTDPATRQKARATVVVLTDLLRRLS